MEIANPTKQYHHEPHSVHSCQYHIIFCPKYRRKVLEDKIADRLKELVEEKQDEFGYELLEMEVMPDHIHLLLDISPKTSIYTVIGKIKGHTSHTLRSEFPGLKKRIPTLWTRSSFISSVGSVSLETVKKYIENQKNV